MRSLEFDLEKGITVGSVEHKRCRLREATAGDVIAASEASEQLVLVPVGVDHKGNPITDPQLVASPTRTAMEVLRLQIVSIGDLVAPIEPEQFAKLSAKDLQILQEQSELLEKASVEVSTRGRVDPAGERAEEQS